MAETHLLAELAETALLIECTHCGSGFAVRPGTAPDFWAGKCFACGENLADINAAARVEGLYRQLCEQAGHCGARVRLRVPTA
jgi:hypothetical protein